MGRLPDLYHLPLEFGSNQVGQKFESFWKLNRVPLLSDNPEEDLKSFLQSSNSTGTSLKVEKVHQIKRLLGATKTSKHLERLWAKEEVQRLLYNPEPFPQEAQDLAIQSRLVTPVSGAVVLETQQQYDRANLKPGERAQAPTVPEPKVYGIAGAIFLMLLAILRRWRLRNTLKLRRLKEALN